MSERMNWFIGTVEGESDVTAAVVFPQTPFSFTKTIESVNVILTLHGELVLMMSTVGRATRVPPSFPCTFVLLLCS